MLNILDMTDDSKIRLSEHQQIMKIVYMAWGEKYIQQISDSIKSSALPTCQVYVVTDKYTDTSALPDDVYVIRKHIDIQGKLTKLKLLSLLPDSIGTILFLDVDTVVTGVMFLNTSNPMVGKIFELACSIAEKDEVTPWGDQTYITLAMEILGFNPYTLSTSFNYRAFGELLSGQMRIWHSYKTMPAKVCDLEKGYLYRYEKGEMQAAKKVPVE